MSASAPAPDLDLACRELVELVTEYLEGALPSGERARFEAHLAACEACVEYVEQLRRTAALMGRLREADLEPAAREQLLSLFGRWRDGSR